MQTIQQLRERRNARAQAARKLLEDNPEKWTSELQAKFDELDGEVAMIDRQITNMQKLIDIDAETKLGDKDRENSERNQRDLPDTDPRKIFDTWMRNGDKAVTAEQWAIIRNTMSTTTTTEGGFTVATTVVARLIEQLKAFGGMRNVAEVFRTAQGNPINWPTSDGTSEVGELIAENTTATDLDPSFGTVALSVYKYSSKIVTIPFELLQDSVIDVEAMVLRRLAQRLGRITNTHFTTGTGTGQPRGAVTAASSGKVGTTGQTLTVIYDDLVDLIHSLDPSYRELGCQWMMRDSSVQVIRKLKDTSGRPIWMPSYEAGITQSAPATLLGYPIQINQDVAAMAANAKSILFGAFNYGYKIRDVMDMTMFRFTDSAYAKKGQVAFLAWLRSGGQCVDTSAFKFYQNSAT